MTFFAISRKTIAAALLALAAVLFSSTAKADHFYYALVSEHQVPITVAWNADKTVCTGAVATINAPVDAEKSKLYKVQQWVDDYSQNWFSFSVELKTADIPYGYAFDGWYRLTVDAKEGTEPLVREDYGTLLSSELKYTIDFPTSNLRYYYDGDWYNWYHYKYPVFVGFTPISSEVTFDYNDESGNAAVVTETYDTSYGLPVDPTRVGHTFLGWYTAREGGSEITEDTVVKTTTAQTLYAHWQALAPTITFDPQDGTVSPASQTITYGSAYTLPTPTRTGYTFDGWYTAATGGTMIADEGTSAFLVDQTLYAHWSIIRTQITVNKSGNGSGTVSPSGSDTYDYGKELTLTATPATGSKFVRWNDGVTTATRTITVSAENKTYVAQFDLKTFKVTFDAGGGTVSTPYKTVTYSEKYGELPQPTWTGHTFVEWRTSGGSRITADTRVDLSGDITLFAHYTTNTYLVQVLRDTAGEGFGSVSNGGTYKYGDVVTIQATPNDGSRFVAWNDGNVNASRTFTVTENVTYTATFALCEYTVSFVYYDASGAQVTASQQVKYRKSAVPPSDEVVNRYPKHRFTGWGNTSYGTITGDLVIRANYDWNTYTIRYNANASSGVYGSMGNQSLKVDVQYSLSPNKFSRTGYTFLGWARDSVAVEKEFSDGQTVDALTTDDGGIVDLYAVWQAEEYIVNFDANGGSAPSPSTKSVVYDSTYGTLPTCSRTGYTFEGWYTAKTGGTKIDESTTVAITADQTLFAHWKAKEYSVRYECENCSMTTAPESGVFANRLYVSWTPDMASGYEFKFDSAKVYAGDSAEGALLHSWDEASYGYFTMSDEYYESVFVEISYAKVARNYNVTFNSNGGSNCDSITVTFNKPYGNLPEPTRTDFSFVEWRDENGNRIDSTSIVSIAGNHRLTAQWKVKTYTIKFDANGGKGEMESMEVERNAMTALPANSFIKLGYIFQSWRYNSKGYADEAEIYNLADADAEAVLVAQWQPISYTIQFDANWNGGANILKTEVPEPIEDCLYTDLIYLDPWWQPETGGLVKFLGWAKSPDAVKPDFEKDDCIDVPLSSEQGATVILYAVWEDSRNELTRAVGCDNMVITSERTGNGDTSIGLEWRVSAKGGVESGGYQGSSVPYNLGSWMSATANGPGVLVFKWQKQRLLEDSTASCVFAYDGVAKSSISVADETLVIYECIGDKQHNFRWTARKGGESGVADKGGILRVSYIRWYPNMTKEEVEAMYANPEPTAADAPTISGDFSFKTDERFDYVIWKKTDLSEPTWTKLKTVTGNGESVPLPMFEGRQGFFKVEVIQRKDQ